MAAPTKTDPHIWKRMSYDSGTAFSVTQQYSTSANASSTALAITGTPEAGKSIVIDDLVICTDTALTLTVRTTTPTIFMKLYVGASAPVQITLRNGLRSPTINVAVEILSSAAGNITATCCYHSE